MFFAQKTLNLHRINLKCNMEVRKFIAENEQRFIDELFSLIRIPSISSQKSHKPDMQACAERWRTLLLEAGADKAEVMESDGNPLVYAEKHVSDEARTVLIRSLRRDAGGAA